MTIKFVGRKPKRIAKLEEVNSTLLHCIVALMKVDDEPRIKELQLIMSALKRKYEFELKIEKKNELERSSKKNTP